MPRPPFCLSGLTIALPTLVTRVFPGIAINLAFVIHANEAVLAFGTIFIFVHLFHAHFRPEVFPFDPVIFTGRVPVDEVREFRAREYESRFGPIVKESEPPPPEAGAGESH